MSLVSIKTYHGMRLTPDCPNPAKQISQQIFASSVWVYVTMALFVRDACRFSWGTGHLRRNPVRLQPVGGRQEGTQIYLV